MDGLHHNAYHLTFAVFSFIFCTAHAFNVDINYAIVKETPDSNFYFGYSVAQHSINADVPKFDRILVGAPHALSAAPAMSAFERTGALYNCTVDLSQPQHLTNDCTELQYPDTSALHTDLTGTAMRENKTDMWLGVNIRSAGAGKVVVACGHRYKIVEPQTNVYGLGVCYYYKSNLELNTEDSKLPCAGELLISSQGSSITGEFGLCAAGMGLAAAENDVIYGLAGAGIWRGTASWVREPEVWPNHPFTDTVDPTPSVGAPNTGPYTYLGSSAVIVKNLLNDNRKRTVVGAPRENERGSVLIFELEQVNKELVESLRLNGTQFGAGFGHSVAVIDINMDEHPALVVGAPFYRSVLGDDKDTSRTIGGAVHIYYNFGNGIGESSEEVITPGACQSGMVIEQCNNAQFGYAISSLGDINGDGFEDLAIGAPFYGRGAVFIYNGQANYKLAKEASQIVMASELDFDFLSRPISGFGISLSGGHDMDEQGFTDVLVGAFASSHVVVLRSQPVVTIDGTIEIANNVLDPKPPACRSDPASHTPCIDYKICFIASFTDKSRNSASETVSIEYTLTGDSGYEFPNNRRVTYNLTAAGPLNSVYTETISLIVDGQQSCLDQYIYLPHTRDLLKAIEFSLTYELIEPQVLTYDNINAHPVMDIYTAAAPIASIDFQRDCNTTNCETDLAVSAMFTDVENVIEVNEPGQAGSEEYAFDSNKVSQLDFAVKLKVDGTKDQAYEPVLYVFLEPELSYTGAAVSIDESTSCSGNAEINAVVCNFGRAIPKGEERQVILTLDFQNLGPTFSTIKVEVNTTSGDTLLANNYAELKVKVNIVTDLELLGSVTKGDNVKYGGGEIRGALSMESDDEVGDLVQHTYTIINSGDHGVISKVSLVVQWPYEIAASGEYLLYMISFPRLENVESGKGQCRVSDDYINKLGLEIVDESPPEESTTVRYKREVKQTAAVRTEASGDGSSPITVADLNCYDRTATCFNITCEFFNILPREVIRVRFNSRLWNSSLAKDFGGDVDVVQITSTGHLYIDPEAKVSQTDTKNDGTNVTTEAVPDIDLDSKGQPIEYWIIIVAVVAGLILLIIIIIIFWKCGFFKRDRPPTYGVKVEKPKEGVMYNQVPQSEPDPLT